MTIDIRKLTPKFILNDRNGYALAKALEAGLNILAETVDAGIKCVTDVDAMPEWRLDEMAWEYDCLYDTKADIEAKRHWIADVIPMYSIHGTAAGLKQYLTPVFGEVDIDEYEGDFAFDVILYGDISPETLAWADKATEAAKNVRSVRFGDMYAGATGTIELEGEAECYAIEYPRCGALICGES